MRKHTIFGIEQKAPAAFLALSVAVLANGLAHAKEPYSASPRADVTNLMPKAVSLMRRGDYWREHGEIEKALDLYNKAIEADARAADAYFNRARVWEEFGKMDKALKDLDTAIKLRKPFHEGALRNRGDLYQSLRQFENAIRDYSTIIKEAPTDGLYINRATCYLRINKPEIALRDFNQALKICGPRPILLEKRGDAYVILKQDAKALADYDMTLKLDPEGDQSRDGHEHLHRSRAEIYKRMGKTDLYKKELAAAAKGRNANMDIAPFSSYPMK